MHLLIIPLLFVLHFSSSCHYFYLTYTLDVYYLCKDLHLGVKSSPIAAEKHCLNSGKAPLNKWCFITNARAAPFEKGLKHSPYKALPKQVAQAAHFTNQNCFPYVHVIQSIQYILYIVAGNEAQSHSCVIKIVNANAVWLDAKLLPPLTTKRKEQGCEEL